MYPFSLASWSPVGNKCPDCLPFVAQPSPKSIVAGLRVELQPLLYMQLPGDPPTITASAANIPMVITTKTGKRRAMIHQSSKAKAVRKSLLGRVTALSATQLVRDISPPLSAKRPLFAHVAYVFPHNPGDKNQDTLEFHIKRPDGDNLLKNLCDALEKAGLIGNDSYLARETIDKFIGPQTLTGIHIMLGTITIST